MTQIQGNTPEEKRRLELYALGPVKYLPAKRADFRVQKDGTVYHVTPRGWRYVTRAANRRALNELLKAA